MGIVQINPVHVGWVAKKISISAISKT